MNKYDFDHVIDRRNTFATKHEGLMEMYGRSDLTPLWIADLDFAVCPEIINALKSRLEHPVIGYSTPPDSYWQSIIDWQTRRHGFKFSREEITFIPGVLKGIALAINYFTKKGDKVLIQPPVYHPFKRLIEGNERQVVENPLLFDGRRYSMDLEGLEKVVRDQKPRLMILCNPHNPIGLQWDNDTLAEVGRICELHGTTVISDEIHGDLTLGARRHIAFADASPLCDKVAITLGAPSKTFNIPGLVSSWMVIRNPQLRRGFFDWLSVNEFNSPVILSAIGTEAAYNFGEEWLDQMLGYVEGNIRFVDDFLKANCPKVRAILPEVSFLVWLDFSSLELSPQQLMGLLVDQAHVAVCDGAIFGKQGTGFVRLNVGTPRSVLAQALNNIAKAISNK